jgi:Raf kinase inhibitor-like YbhB/YbcL family protein
MSWSISFFDPQLKKRHHCCIHYFKHDVAWPDWFEMVRSLPYIIQTNIFMITDAVAGFALVVLQISSPSFSQNGFIPSTFSCEGENKNPALSIKNIPAGTQSLALIVEDPDAPQGTVYHWVAWNIEPTGTIPEKTPVGTQGKNTKGENGYMGPCPPIGIHHYHFKVFALDSKLDLREGSTKAQLEDAMKDHVIGSGELIGLYQKAAH